jgi:outer membrane protein
VTFVLPKVPRAAASLLGLCAAIALPGVADGGAASAPHPSGRLDLRLHRAAGGSFAPAVSASGGTSSMALAWADVEAAAPDALADVRARGEVTLEDAYRLALAVSLRVGQAREEYLRSRADLTTARAQILPYVSLEDTYYKQSKVTIGASSGAGLTFADERNEALVRVQQPIFSGLRDIYFARFARDTMRALRHGLNDTGRLLYRDTAVLFYDSLENDARVKTLQDQVTVERERLREIDARREVGLARRTEVLLAQSQLGDDESLLTGAINDSLVARQRLALLAGVPVDLPLRDDVEIGEVPDAADAEAAVEALLREARENRADLKQAHSAIDAAKSQVSFARGGYFPTVGLNAAWILDRYNFSEFNERTDWTAEVDFRLPLFDGGRTRASVARARSDLRDAEIARTDLEYQVRLEVNDRWLSLQSGLALLKTIETRLTYTDENYRLIQEEYRAGLATNLEVIAAQNQFLSARLDLDRQRYLNKLEWVGLRIAQGLLPGSSVPETAGPGGAEAQ